MMNTTEHNLEPAQSLQLITEMIGRTRENLKVHSFLYLVWGWIIALASLLFFVLHTYTSSRWFFLPFPVLSGIGIILTVRYHTGRRYASETYLAFYLRSLWLVLGLGFILTVFVSLSLKLQPFSFTLLIGGIGTLISGLMLRFRPLIIGGLLFFGFAIASVFTDEIYRPLLQGIAVVSGYLVPGYLLKYART